MPAPTDAEAIAYIASLAELEQQPGHSRATFSIGPYKNFVLVSALQLALRHPDLSPTLRGVISEMTEQFKTPYLGTAGEEILEAGGDPANDVPQGRGRSLPATISPLTDWSHAGPVAELTEKDDDVSVTLEVKHPVVYEGHRARLTVGAHTLNDQAVWLPPDQADLLAAWLHSAAAEARRLDAGFAEQDRQHAEYLRDHPPAATQ